MTMDMAWSRGLLLVIIAASVVRFNSSAPTSYQGITWSSKPGNFSSLEKTDTIFNWTHTSAPHPINIGWFHKKLLLQYDNKSVHKFEEPRAEYDEFPGSAVLILRNVTAVDSGLYEARVAVIDPKTLHNTPYISDVIRFSVVKESTLAYTVTIAGHTHHLSVTGNGTNLTLPTLTWSDDTMVLPDVFDLGVDVNISAPKPASISLGYHLGTNENSSLCHQAYTCYTKVKLTDVGHENHQIDMEIVIDFEVQNLDRIYITRTVELVIGEVKTYSWIGWTFLAFLLFIGFTIGSAISRGKLKDRCSSKAFPVRPRKGESKRDLQNAKKLRHRTLHHGQASEPGTTDTPYDIDSLIKDPKFMTYSTSLKEKYLVPFEDIQQASAAEYFYRISVDTTLYPKGSMHMCHIQMIINGLQNSCGGRVAITCKKYAWGKDRWKSYIRSSLPPNVEFAQDAEYIGRDQPLIACLNVRRRKGSAFTYQEEDSRDKYVMYFLLRDDGNIDNIGGRVEEVVVERSPPTLTPQATPNDSTGHVPTPTTAALTTATDDEAPSDDRTDDELTFGPLCSRSFVKSGFETKLDNEEIKFEELNTFREAQPVQFTPSKTELENGPHWREAISDIENLSLLDGFAVVLENDIACGLMEDATGAREGHLADVIHVDTGPKISIIAVYDPANKTEGCGIERRKRTFGMARFVMKKLSEKALSEKQIYVHPLTHSAGKVEGDRERKWLCSADLSEIKRCLGMFLLQDKTGFKDRINSAITVRLTEEQCEVVLGLRRRKFCLIEGAPGTGKTLLEQHFCERNGKDQCAILCQSIGVTAYINYEGKAEAHLTPRDAKETLDLLRGRLRSRKYIIIDDAQYIAWSRQSWEALIKAIKSSSQHLYIFMDSQHQMYKAENTARIIGRLIGAELGSIVPMMKIHRNSDVVFEYMKTHAPEKEAWENMKCVCRIQGDDAKLSRVPDVQDLSGQNGLLTFVKSLVASLRYNYSDIAILFDADNTAPGHENMQTLFRKQLADSRVQTCEKFPVQGIVIDTVDNFLGLDAPCVIMVLSHSSALKNSRYLLTIASRAVKRLEFVKLNFNKEETKLLKFEDAPIEKRQELRDRQLPDSDHLPTHAEAVMAESLPQIPGDEGSVSPTEITDRRLPEDSVTIEMDEISPLLPPRDDSGDGEAGHQRAHSEDDSEIDGPDASLIVTSGLTYGFDVSCEPNSVLELPNGQILVTDFHHGQIYLLTKDLRLLRSFDNGSVTPSAAGIVRDSGGNIYVAEQVNDTITVYDSQYNLARQITNDTIEDDNYMTGPLGLVLTKENLLYFCDSRNHRIQVRKLDGTFVTTFGQRGKGAGDFKHHPCFIDVSHRGLVAVTDRGGRLYLFTPLGVHQYTYKPFTVDPSVHIQQARGVTFHPSGKLIVADAAGKLLVLTVEGEIVTTIGERGAGVGQLQWPRDLCVTAKGDLLVCEKENHRVQLFRRPLP